MCHRNVPRAPHSGSQCFCALLDINAKEQPFYSSSSCSELTLSLLQVSLTLRATTSGGSCHSTQRESLPAIPAKQVWTVADYFTLSDIHHWPSFDCPTLQTGSTLTSHLTVPFMVTCPSSQCGPKDKPERLSLFKLNLQSIGSNFCPSICDLSWPTGNLNLCHPSLVARALTQTTSGANNGSPLPPTAGSYTLQSIAIGLLLLIALKLVSFTFQRSPTVQVFSNCGAHPDLNFPILLFSTIKQKNTFITTTNEGAPSLATSPTFNWNNSKCNAPVVGQRCNRKARFISTHGDIFSPTLKTLARLAEMSHFILLSRLLFVFPLFILLFPSAHASTISGLMHSIVSSYFNPSTQFSSHPLDVSSYSSSGCKGVRRYLPTVCLGTAFRGALAYYGHTS